MTATGWKKLKIRFVFGIIRYVVNDIRQLNRNIYVRIRDKKARILGRINMYSIIVDLNNSDAEVGDEVLLDINPLLIKNSIEREYVSEMNVNTPLDSTVF